MQVSIIELHRAALALDINMVLELVGKVLAGRTMSRAQVPRVGHVVEDLLGMNADLA